MSILSQIAPRDPDGMVSIDIPLSTNVSRPHLPVDDGPVEQPESGHLVTEAKKVSRSLLCGLADDMAVGELEAGLDEYVDVWTPTVHTRSRFELISVMMEVDDAIGEVVVAFAESAATQSIAMLGWHATARFVRPAFLDDDHLLEPTGAVISVAGASSVSFTATGRIHRIRCHYDRLALIEQIVTPSMHHRTT